MSFVIKMGSGGQVQPRAFDIGRTGRRIAAIPSVSTAINAQIRQYGSQALARSRYLCKNNPYAQSARRAFVSALVGTGIKPSKLDETAEHKAAIQELWFDWTDQSDAEGRLDHYGQQELGAGELFEAGEFFAIIEDAPHLLAEGLPPLQLRLLQSEMLPMESTHLRPEAGNRIEMGIEFDSMNRRVAYHFLKRMPGDNHSGLADLGTIRVPAERVIHVFKPIAAGQVRGVPHTLAGMVTLAMLDLYDDAELERKRVAALFAGFIKRQPGDDEGDSPLGALVSMGGGERDAVALEPGAMIDLDEGEDVAFAEPADVGGNYETFQYRMLLRAAAGFGVPYAAFTGDLKSVNYSSIRAGLVEFRRQVEAMQHHIMVFQFCRPVWRHWLTAAVFHGLAPWKPADYHKEIRKHLRVKWIPPKWEWVDPLKDLQAEKLAVDNGYKARSDVIEATGYDPEEVDARILADQQRAESLGLSFADSRDMARETPASTEDERNTTRESEDGPPPTTEEATQ